MDSRCLQRMSGYVRKRVHELKLGTIPDPRRRQGRRWKLRELLSATLVGMLAGCKGLGEVEELTAHLSSRLRGALNIPRRVADTTLRDALCKLSFEDVRGLLHRAVVRADRRKALKRSTGGVAQLALDGKAVALPSWDGPYAQRVTPKEGAPFGLLRTVTSTLVTSAGRPCLDISPVPAETNEKGHFPAVFREQVKRFGHLFELVSYDAGVTCESNAALVVELGKHYLLRLNDDRWRLQQLAGELLATTEPVAERTDTLSNHAEVVRTLRVFQVNHGPLPELPRKSPIWSHTRVLVQVDSQTIEHGETTSCETRYFVSSLPLDRMTLEHWLHATVLHWGVETCHQILDVAFLEDDSPWINADPGGVLVVLALRRVAYTLLTLWRSVSMRSDENRTRPWRGLMRLLFIALLKGSLPNEGCVAATV